jgi:TfoX/Sxy family transcriptional regulator of competence genes
MAYSEELASRVREILEEDLRIDERKMFGGLAFMVNGHMCCGIRGDDLMLRLGPDRADEALKETDVRPMDFTGRPMKGYVYADSAGLKAEADLRRWLQLARDFNATLAPKS